MLCSWVWVWRHYRWIREHRPHDNNVYPKYYLRSKCHVEQRSVCAAHKVWEFVSSLPLSSDSWRVASLIAGSKDHSVPSFLRFCWKKNLTKICLLSVCLTIHLSVCPSICLPVTCTFLSPRKQYLPLSLLYCRKDPTDIHVSKNPANMSGLDFMASFRVLLGMSSRARLHCRLFYHRSIAARLWWLASNSEAAGRYQCPPDEILPICGDFWIVPLWF